MTMSTSLRPAMTAAVTDLAQGIAGHLPTTYGPWTVEQNDVLAVTITDGRRAIVLTETPGSAPHQSALQLFADAHPIGRPADRVQHTVLEHRTAQDPRAAAHHLARTLLAAVDRQLIDGMPRNLAEEYRVQAGEALLATLSDYQQQRANVVICPGLARIAWTPLHGGSAVARIAWTPLHGCRAVAQVDTTPDHVHISMDGIPLPAAGLFLEPLLPRPTIPPPGNRDRLPADERTYGRAARQLSTRFDLTPTWADARHGRGDEHNAYTTELTHQGATAVEVTVPPGAPGRATTTVTVHASCGLDTALLALSTLR
jgi:hypothetical protein